MSYKCLAEESKVYHPLPSGEKDGWHLMTPLRIKSVQGLSGSPINCTVLWFQKCDLVVGTQDLVSYCLNSFDFPSPFFKPNVT